MKVLRELLLVGIAALGWHTALRERERAERIRRIANTSVTRIRRDVAGAGFRFGETDATDRTFSA